MRTKTLGRLLAATATCALMPSTAHAGDYGQVVDTSSPITNYDTIEGDRIGIYSVGTNLILDNYGVVSGDGFSLDFNDPDAGIVIIGGPRDMPDGFVDVYNNAGGWIIGESAGIATSYFLNPDTNELEGRAIGVTIINDGTIIGSNDDGIRLIGGGTVTNSGYIAGRLGNGADGISMLAYSDQDTSGFTSIGTVDNSGTIEGNRLGIILSDGGTVNNSGTINGGWAGSIVIQAVDPGKVGLIDNDGTINGDLTFNDLVSASVTNGGSINGAIAFNGVGSSTVDNSGSIHSQDGAAPIASDGDLNITNSLTGSIVNDTQSGIVSGGALTLDNAGEIRADQAVAVMSTGASDDITNSGTISSYWDAIFTLDSPTTLRNSGSIESSHLDGAQLQAGGTVDNSGEIFGGTNGLLLGGPTSVTNEADGRILGGRDGILATGASLDVDNAGIIYGNGTNGSSTSPNGGIVVSGGPATITNSGTISGQRFGVTTSYFLNPDTNEYEGRAVGNTVNNSGTIIGSNDDGIRLIGGGGVTNSGYIGGKVGSSADGVSMFGYFTEPEGPDGIGTVDNLAGGIIEGNRWGVILSGGGTVNNAGTITATGPFVSGLTGAILIQATTAGKTGTVDNSGTLNGDVGFHNPVTASFDNSGTLNGEAWFDTIDNASLVNSGTIASASLPGIIDNVGNGTMTIANQSTGSITGATSGILSTGSSLDLTNAGTVRGNGTNGSQTSPDGGLVISGGPATITNSGTISGQRFGITTSYFVNPDTSASEGRAIGSAIENSGTVIGDNDDGVRLIGGGSVTNSGYIAGRVGSSADGVSMFGFFADPADQDAIGTVDNLAGGTIVGHRWGVILSGGGTIDNAGTITGPGPFSGGLSGALLIQATSPGKIGDITNSGTINGDVGFNSVVTAAFTNSGTVNGEAWFDVTDASVVNSGNINGRIGSYDTGSMSITNSGTIAGPSGPAIYAETQTSLVNSGSISSSGPTAVSLLGANAADTVTLLTGSSIAGAVDGGSGSDTLNLSGTIASATPLQTVGQFLNFEAVNVYGGYWTAPAATGTFGATTINGGTLAVNGSITSPITVMAGATLAGSGTIAGNITLGAGARLSPGNSVGTIHVTGNVSFASGSTFQVETTPGGLSDVLAATGSVSLGSGTTLQIVGGSGTYAAQTQYTIITAIGGINGKFGTITSDLAFLKPIVAFKNTSVLLTLSRNGKPITSAATANTLATAAAIESLNQGSPIYQAVLMQSAGGARQAFEALSGASYRRLDAVLASDFGHPQLGLEGKSSPEPSIQWSSVNQLAASGFHSGSSMNRGPFSLMLVGGSYGMKVASDSVQSDVWTRFLSTAIGYRSNRFQALGSMTSAWHEVAANRSVIFPGFADLAQGHYTAQSHRLDFEGSYALSRGAIAIAPYAGASRFMLRSQGFQESGGVTALSFQSSSSAVDQVRAGMRMSGDFAIWGARLLPHMDLSVRRSWAGDSAMTGRFVTGSDEFDNGASGFDSRTAAIDAGADLMAGPVTFSASYRAQVGDRWREQSGLLSASLRF